MPVPAAFMWPLRRSAMTGSRQFGCTHHAGFSTQHPMDTALMLLRAHLQGRAQQLPALDSTGSQVLALQQNQLENTFDAVPPTHRRPRQSLHDRNMQTGMEVEVAAIQRALLLTPSPDSQTCCTVVDVTNPDRQNDRSPTVPRCSAYLSGSRTPVQRLACAATSLPLTMLYVQRLHCCPCNCADHSTASHLK
jgi:hypothetical protein